MLFRSILAEKENEISLAKFYDKTTKNMANIRKQINIITNDPDPKLSGADKKIEIDRLHDLISELAKQAEEARKDMKK